MADSTKQVSLVVVGVSRTVGLNLISPLFDDTPYNIVAVLDLVTSPEMYRYTPQNLGVVLNALHPRPRALVVGTAVDLMLLPELESVWWEFQNDMIRGTNGNGASDTAVVLLPKTHPNPGGTGSPPKVYYAYISFGETSLANPSAQGWDNELLKQLDAVFRPQQSFS